MMLWHNLLQIYHAKRALRYALASRHHLEKGEAHMRRAREIEGSKADV